MTVRMREKLWLPRARSPHLIPAVADTVELTRGVASISGTITLGVDSLALVGQGIGATTLLMAANLPNGVIRCEATGDRARWNALRGFLVRGSGTAANKYRSATGVGVYLFRCSEPILENIEVQGVVGEGFKFEGVWDGLFSKLLAEWCGNVATTKYQVWLDQDAASGDDCGDNKFVDSHFAQAFWRCIYIGPDAQTTEFLALHSEAEVTVGQYDGIYIDGGKGTQIVAPLMGGFGGTARAINVAGSTSYRTVIVGGQMWDNNVDIRFNALHCHAIGVTINGLATGNGIELDSQRCVVVGCVLDSHAYGVYEGASADENLIGPNVYVGQATRPVYKVGASTVVVSSPGYATRNLGMEHHTAGDTLTTNEPTVHSNLGAAGAIALTLPQTVDKGMSFKFVVMAAQQLRVDPGAAGAIYINGAKQADDKYIWADDEGESVELIADGNGDWAAIGAVGTWGVEA